MKAKLLLFIFIGVQFLIWVNVAMVKLGAAYWPTAEYKEFLSQKEAQEKWDKENERWNSDSDEAYIVRDEQYLANQRTSEQVDRLMIHLKDYYHRPKPELSSKEKAKWAREQTLLLAKKADQSSGKFPEYDNVVCYPEFGCTFRGRLTGFNDIDHLADLLEGRNFKTVDLGPRPKVTPLQNLAYNAPWYWLYLQVSLSFTPLFVIAIVAVAKQLSNYIKEKRKLKETAQKEVDAIVKDGPYDYREHICSGCGRPEEKK